MNRTDVIARFNPLMCRCGHVRAAHFDHDPQIHRNKGVDASRLDTPCILYGCGCKTFSSPYYAETLKDIEGRRVRLEKRLLKLRERIEDLKDRQEELGADLDTY